MIRSPFGKKMRECRESHNPPISVRKLAGMLGFSAAYISDIERGLRLPPTDDRVEQIEEILGCVGKLRRLAQVERIGIKYGELSESGAARIVEIMSREGIKV